MTLTVDGRRVSIDPTGGRYEVELPVAVGENRIAARAAVYADAPLTILRSFEQGNGDQQVSDRAAVFIDLNL